MTKFGIEKGKPLVLPNGTKVSVGEDTVIETKDELDIKDEIEDVTSDPFAAGTETFSRTLADTTVPAKQFNPIMLVLSYSMWGLDQYAIARYLDIDIDRVTDIMSSDLFSRTRIEILEAIRYAEAGSIHGYLSQKARDAAATIAHAMKSKKDDVRLSAAKDVLDRAGFRPIDRTEHVHRFEDELRIVHLKEANTIEIDTGV